MSVKMKHGTVASKPKIELAEVIKTTNKTLQVLHCWTKSEITVFTIGFAFIFVK